jgi:hypothetical protein
MAIPSLANLIYYHPVITTATKDPMMIVLSMITPHLYAKRNVPMKVTLKLIKRIK